MMKKIPFAVLAAVLLSVGCTKTEISEDSVSQSISNDATIDFSKCKLRRISVLKGDGFTSSALFTYNKAGNPFSVTYSDVGTGVANHYFFYDAKNRLTRYQQAWIDYVIEDHFYSHNDAGQIIKDSLVHQNCCGIQDKTYVSTIEYDSQGRVIKEIIVNTFDVYGERSPTRRPTYTYDARGNLAVAQWKSSSYDNKINPLRQNPIFQFIHRNYSMNNPAVQAKYNSMGLPLALNPYNDQFFNDWYATRLVYDCQ